MQTSTCRGRLLRRLFVAALHAGVACGTLGSLVPIARACPGDPLPASAYPLTRSLPQPGDSTHTVVLQVQDLDGTPLIARVHVQDATGAPWPGGFDADLMTHQDWPWMLGYFYVDGNVVMQVPTGPTDIVIGRGFEWRPASLTPSITSDTTITVQLRKVFDMRANHWHSGDVHGHAAHLPSNYPVPPENVMRVVQAEDLAMSWILNPIEQWTGTIHALSLPQHQAFYSIEHRNQAFGHACLIGLVQSVPTGCCTPPASPYPLLSMFREEWNPGPEEALTLAHPCTGAGFMDDDAWPAWGMGRELPVVAATGNLDALDIVSYSNLPENWELDEYYDLLNCGVKIAPSAGTDAALNVFWTRPIGGYRVYVDTGSPTLDSGEWVRSYKAGRSFVTNYPLLPVFQVGGAQAGSTLVVTPGEDLPITVEIQSVLRVDTLEGRGQRQSSSTPSNCRWAAPTRRPSSRLRSR